MARPLLLAALALLIAAPSAGAPITFLKIADAATPGPGWGVNVAFSAPAVDSGVVAFNATDPFTSRGTYTGTGAAVSVVADDSTLIPGRAETFNNFVGSPSISGGTVAFVASDPSGFPSVYRSTGGTLDTIATFGDPEPGGNGGLNVAGIGPSTDGAGVAFLAFDGSGNAGVYTGNGVTVDTVADENTSDPGGGGSLFVSGPVDADGGSVAFEASTLAGDGIYVAAPGTIRNVADGTTPVPGGAGNFVAFTSGPSFDSGNIAFEGVGSDRAGIYAEISGALELIADTETLIPGSTESFDSFFTPGLSASISGDDVAFYGSSAFGPSGLYLRANGTLAVVIEIGDSLDGKTVFSLRFGPEGFDDGQIAFAATFTDGTTGVFLASVPEPSSALLLGAGLAMLGMRGRPRRG